MKKFLLGLFAILLISCAQPPKAEIDNANAALARLEKSTDVVAYAPDSIQLVKNEIGKMNGFVKTGKYDQAKTSAIMAVTSADKAVKDASNNKERARSSAETIIKEIEKIGPELTLLIERAKKVPRIVEALPTMESDMKGYLDLFVSIKKTYDSGNYLIASADANKLFGTLVDLQQKISTASMQTSKKK